MLIITNLSIHKEKATWKSCHRHLGIGTSIGIGISIQVFEYITQIIFLNFKESHLAETMQEKFCNGFFLQNCRDRL